MTAPQILRRLAYRSSDGGYAVLATIEATDLAAAAVAVTGAGRWWRRVRPCPMASVAVLLQLAPGSTTPKDIGRLRLACRRAWRLDVHVVAADWETAQVLGLPQPGGLGLAAYVGILPLFDTTTPPIRASR